MSLEHSQGRQDGAQSFTKPRTLSIAQTAKIMGVSISTCYEAVHAGQLPVIRVGRLLRVPVAALEKMLQGEE